MLYREDLDPMHCQTPGCDHAAHDGLYLVSRCHPRAGASVMYHDGTMFVTCRICGKDIASIAVASRPTAARAKGPT